MGNRIAELEPKRHKSGYDALIHECLEDNTPREFDSISINVSLNVEDAAEKLTMKLRLNALEYEVKQLRKIVEDKKSTDSENLDPKIEDVIGVTSELFECTPKVEIDFDPSNPDETFVVFNVSFNGTSAEMVQKRLLWHRKIRELESGKSSLRLSIKRNESN